MLFSWLRLNNIVTKTQNTLSIIYLSPLQNIKGAIPHLWFHFGTVFTLASLTLPQPVYTTTSWAVDIGQESYITDIPQAYYRRIKTWQQTTRNPPFQYVFKINYCTCATESQVRQSVRIDCVIYYIWHTYILTPLCTVV